MKLRKGLVALIISILILAVSTTSFAVTTKNKVDNKVAENKVSNKISNETEDDEVDNKAKNKTNTTNTTNTTKNETKNTTKNETTKAETTTKDSSKSSTIKKSSTTKTINEDIVNAEADENTEYADVKVNGNVFIANSDKVTLSNVKVDGDVIIFANAIEIKDSEIEGSAYVAADKISLSNSELNSVYCAGNSIKVEEGTEISRELRVVGSDITINAEIKRDVYAVGENVEFGDEVVVSGKAVVKAENNEVSDDADITNLDFEKINYSNSSDTSESIITYLIEKGTEIAIILLIALFILYGFPKFSEVNSSLRLRDFFKAFFTGLLEFVVIIAIVIGLFFTGYGVGYGLILLNLLITFIILGKVIFIISFAVRMSCNPEKISKIKAFFATVLVALILAVIEMISIAGTVGIIIDIVINCILAMTGFGSMFRVIFTSKKKLEKIAQRKLEGKKSKTVEPVPEVAIETTAVEEEAGQTELQAEVKKEIKEEINELKEERKEEKKLDKSDSAKEEEKNAEEPKKEEKEEAKEDSKKSEEDKKEDEEKK